MKDSELTNHISVLSESVGRCYRDCEGSCPVCVDNKCQCKKAKTVEWLKELAEYRRQEKEGLLLRLPCKEGDTVYLIDNNTACCFECENHYGNSYCVINDTHNPMCANKPLCEKQFLDVIGIKANLKWIIENQHNFGKSVFLTRADAERALESIGGAE